MNAKIAGRVSDCVPPVVSQIKEKARRLEASGKPLIYLSRGEPDFETPVHIRAAANRALQDGHTHYPPMRGIPELRRAIAGRVGRDFGLLRDPEEEVLVTTGATMGLYIALFALINPGDEVILLDPIYDPYSTLVRLAGGSPIRIEASVKEGRFSVSSQDLENAATKRTKAILINNPWNPTGSVMTPEEISVLVDYAEAHDLILICDEIYEKIVFDDRKHYNLAASSPLARKRTVTVNSFSKTYAMTGWRLGYNLAPPPLTQAMLHIAQQFSRSAASFVQHAGVAALNGPQEAVDKMVDHYARRRERITKLISHSDLHAGRPPEGTFFYFLDIRKYGMDAQSLADLLMEQSGVVTVPGSLYGPAGEGFLRISFAYSEDTLQRGLEALIRFFQRLG